MSRPKLPLLTGYHPLTNPGWVAVREISCDTHGNRRCEFICQVCNQPQVGWLAAYRANRLRCQSCSKVARRSGLPTFVGLSLPVIYVRPDGFVRFANPLFTTYEDVKAALPEGWILSKFHRDGTASPVLSVDDFGMLPEREFPIVVPEAETTFEAPPNKGEVTPEPNPAFPIYATIPREWAKYISGEDVTDDAAEAAQAWYDKHVQLPEVEVPEVMLSPVWSIEGVPHVHMYLLNEGGGILPPT